MTMRHLESLGFKKSSYRVASKSQLHPLQGVTILRNEDLCLDYISAWTHCTWTCSTESAKIYFNWLNSRSHDHGLVDFFIVSPNATIVRNACTVFLGHIGKKLIHQPTDSNRHNFSLQSSLGNPYHIRQAGELKRARTGGNPCITIRLFLTLVAPSIFLNISMCSGRWWTFASEKSLLTIRLDLSRDLRARQNLSIDST